MEGHRYIDQADDLDAGAIGKRGRERANDNGKSGSFNEAGLIDDILSGANYHGAAMSLLGRWASNGMSYLASKARIEEIFQSIPKDDRRTQLADRVAEIPSWLNHIFGNKVQEEINERERLRGLFEDLPEEDEDGTDESDTTRTSGLKFESPSDCEEAATPPYVVKGLLYQGDIGCFYGQPNHGKSIIAPYFNYRVSQGEPFFSMRVKQGKTFYVAAEGAGGMRKRVKALRRRYGEAPDFQLVTGVTNLMPKKNGAASPDQKALLKTIERERPVLIVIDTIARAFAGLEENSSEGMGNVIHVANSLTKWGAAVILIHHPTKSGEHLRGFGGLHGALDMELLVEKAGDIITATAVKARDFADGGKLVFEKSVQVLGQDEDGDDVTTVVLVECDVAAAPKQPDRLNRAATAALRILDELTGNGCGVEHEAWRKACVASGLLSSSENVRSHGTAFTRALEELTAKRRVVLVAGLYSPAKSTDNHGFTYQNEDDDDLV